MRIYPRKCRSSLESMLSMLSISNNAMRCNSNGQQLTFILVNSPEPTTATAAAVRLRNAQKIELTSIHGAQNTYTKHKRKNIEKLKEEELEQKLKSSTVPVVPIELPPPNTTLQYRFADDELLSRKNKFKTDFSKIILPFVARSSKDLKNPRNYGSSRLYESYDVVDVDDSSSSFGSYDLQNDLEFDDFDNFESTEEDQEPSSTNIQTFHRNFNSYANVSRPHKRLRHHDPPQISHDLRENAKGDESNELRSSSESHENKLYKLFDAFESKKLESNGNRDGKLNRSAGNTIPGSSLKELELISDPGVEMDAQDAGKSRKRPRRSVVHLYDMVVCATGCNPLQYKGYGCYCGFLGSGITVDGIDRCCAKHDWCYHHAKCPPFLTYFVPYYWTCNAGRPRCVTEYRGWKGVCGANLCECDRQFAECLRRYPCPRNRAFCHTSPWRFWQNFLMFPRYQTVTFHHHHF